MEATAKGAREISWKQSVEIATTLRGKTVEEAKKILASVINLELPIRYYKFNNGVGHRKGMGAGRYPSKASGEILGILESAEANAVQKGMSSLVIKHISASQTSSQKNSRYGKRGKRAYIEVKLQQA